MKELASVYHMLMGKFKGFIILDGCKLNLHVATGFPPTLLRN